MKFRSPEVQNNKDRSPEDNLKKQRPEDRQTYSEKVSKEEANLEVQRLVSGTQNKT